MIVHKIQQIKLQNGREIINSCCFFNLAQYNQYIFSSHLICD